MKIYLIGVSDAEANRVVSIHKTYDGALKVWNKERKELIKLYKRMKFMEVARGWSHNYNNNWNDNIIKLFCEDPKTIDNYPLDTPYISEFELED